jgi:hypothetical protein
MAVFLTVVQKGLCCVLTLHIPEVQGSNIVSEIIYVLLLLVFLISSIDLKRVTRLLSTSSIFISMPLFSSTPYKAQIKTT